MVVVVGGKCPTPCKKEGKLSKRGKCPRLREICMRGNCPREMSVFRLYSVLPYPAVLSACKSITQNNPIYFK